MSCNFKELADLCDAKGLSDAVDYINSLKWKVWLAEYHAKAAEQKSTSLLGQAANAKNPQNDPAWRNAQYEAEAETIAAAHAMHSMADISAQILNTCLDLGLAENRVYAKQIGKELVRSGALSSIHTAMKDLLDCAAFKYVDAFVNTVKHRRLIDITYNVSLTKVTIVEGVRFKAFDFGGPKTKASHPQTYASDICGVYLSEIVSRICDLIDALIDYLE